MNKLFFNLLLSIAFVNIAYSQSIKDTIYFDDDWSICEKPVAEYYRVCTLNKEKEIFYKGDVEDYYMSGQLEMKGRYTEKGIKEGDFIFYGKNNLLIKKGTYKNDEMHGDWFYYDSLANLKAHFNCNTSTDFTPILIINNNNDTLLKNGNGKFKFNTKKDLNDVFPVAEEFVMGGEVINSLRDGVFYYEFPSNPKPGVDFLETYKKGKFIRGKSYSGAATNTPLKLLNLANENLNKIDRFYHSNLVFGYGTNGDEKVINYLLYGAEPEIESNSNSFYDNDRIIFDVIGTVLRKSLKNASNTNISYNFPSRNPFDLYYSFTSSKNARSINGKIVLTIDTLGYIINTAMDINCNRTEIGKINYYLSHVSKLVPLTTNDEKAFGNINLELKTVLTSSENKTICLYEVFNADSISDVAKVEKLSKESSNISAEDYYKVFTSVQVEAKFPGGQDAWRKYLERNLNYSVAAQHHAPIGSYTVTVGFLVDKDGNISDVQALNDPGYGTAQETVRVIKKGPKWTPAIQNGRNVIYRQKQNITFQVTNDK